MQPYTVESIWRYPVKSMGGEQLGSASVTERGVDGDRVYALFDRVRGKVLSAKTRPELLLHHAALIDDALRITGPDGAVLTRFAEGVDLLRLAPDGALMDIPPDTLGGEMAGVTETGLAGAAPSGTFFDYAQIHILTTATLRALKSAYPEGDFAIDRFRPNLVIDCGDASGFLENDWLDRVLAIGDSLRIRVTIPCPRCVMPILPRPGLPRDPGIVKTASRANSHNLGPIGTLPCVGAYAEVLTPGSVRRGDAVRIE